jgi:hypothetical protein
MRLVKTWEQVLLMVDAIDDGVSKVKSVRLSGPCARKRALRLSIRPSSTTIRHNGGLTTAPPFLFVHSFITLSSPSF